MNILLMRFTLSFSLFLFQNFQLHNTPEQNSQSLKNFDLIEYRQVIIDLSVHIYQELVITIQNNIGQLVGKYIFLFRNQTNIDQ